MRALDALLPRTRQRLLAAFLVRPERAWYPSELARHLGAPPSSLQRELRDLADAKILKLSRKGRMAFYQANSESPLFPDLRGLFLKTAGLVEVLGDALDRLPETPPLAFVFGSMAAGNDDPNSDVDLMIIGQVSPLDLTVALGEAQNRLLREVTPVIFSREDFVKKLKSKDHFLSRVLDKPKLFVLGNEDELGKLVGGGKHRAGTDEQSGTG
jgi:predicted nucleotidyltransferase